jgi:hypothetical protein
LESDRLDGRIGTRQCEAEVVLLSEGRAEEWHFDAESHHARIEEQKAISRKCRESEAMARQQKQAAHVEAEQRTDALLEDLCEEDKLRARMLASLRGELVEAEFAAEEARAECEAQIAEIKAQIAAQRVDRAALEELINEEKSSKEQACRRCAEIEDEEMDLIRRKDQLISSIQQETKQEILKLQRSGDEQVRAMESRMRDELQVLRHRQDLLLRETKSSAQQQVDRRRELMREADIAVREVDDSIRLELMLTHQATLDMQKQTFCRMEEIQRRDFAHDAQLHEHMNCAFAAVHCASQELALAKATEEEHKQRRAADALFLECAYVQNVDDVIREKKIRAGLRFVAGQI